MPPYEPAVERSRCELPYETPVQRDIPASQGVLVRAAEEKELACVDLAQDGFNQRSPANAAVGRGQLLQERLD